jgi:hypothetical protein
MAGEVTVDALKEAAPEVVSRSLRLSSEKD